MKEPRLTDIRGALGKKTKNPLDKWVDKNNVAIWLGLNDEETITNWQKKECMPFVKIGRITLFNLDSVDRWLKGREIILVPEDLAQEKGGMKKGAGVGETRVICPFYGGYSPQNGMNPGQTGAKKGKTGVESDEQK